MPPLSTVDTLFERYQLQSHPEGGWYRELHRSPLEVQRADGEGRSALTLILFLLPGGAVSRWHRVAGADESWHFIGGDPLELLQLPPAGGDPQRSWLGFALEDPSLLPVAVVPAGWSQAARSLGAWSLVSCCVGPGFSFADFSLLSDHDPATYPAGALPAWL
jgi:predicted cupin superfamily sugar epimerase